MERLTNDNHNTPPREGRIKQFFDGLVHLLGGISRIVWISILGIVIIGAMIFGSIAACVHHANKDNKVEIEVDRKINITPAQIVSIQEIGQWEFLAVSDEEIVDTVRRGYISDDELVRIYYGTVRLGIDLHKAAPHWLRVEGDSLAATLPKIELLDRNFIDEARTKSFYESGSWTNADREVMYQRAYQKMLRRCMTPENVATATQNARTQFTQLLRSMGFDRVRVEVEDERLKMKN